MYWYLLTLINCISFTWYKVWELESYLQSQKEIAVTNLCIYVDLQSQFKFDAESDVPLTAQEKKVVVVQCRFLVCSTCNVWCEVCCVQNLYVSSGGICNNWWYYIVLCCLLSTRHQHYIIHMIFAMLMHAVMQEKCKIEATLHCELTAYSCKLHSFWRCLHSYHS